MKTKQRLQELLSSDISDPEVQKEIKNLRDLIRINRILRVLGAIIIAIILIMIFACNPETPTQESEPTDSLKTLYEYAVRNYDIAYLKGFEAGKDFSIWGKPAVGDYLVSRDSVMNEAKILFGQFSDVFPFGIREEDFSGFKAIKLNVLGETFYMYDFESYDTNGYAVLDGDTVIFEP